MQANNATQLLQQIQEMASQAQGKTQPTSATTSPKFSEILETAVARVSELQQQAGSLSKEYEVGNKSIALSDVMVASQQANISFQALVQVRNHVVKAYQEVMNMPI